MKIFNVLIASVVLLSVAGNVSAQSKKKIIKTEDQKVEYKNENGNKTLTIITNENGKEKTEVYTGEEASRKMDEMNAGKHDAHFKVWADEDGESMGSGNSHVRVFTDDGDVSVINKDGKVIIKKLDKDGKEEIQELDINDMIDKSMGNLQFKMDSNSFSFNFKDMDQFEKDMEIFGKDMERFGKDMEEHMKILSDKDVIIHKFDFNGDDAKSKVIIKQDEESLTPAEIKEKYGVDVNADGDEVVIKKVIKVKKDDTEKAADSVKELNKIGDANVFPNPGNGQYTLNYNAGKGGKTTVEVKDSKGSVVYNSEFTMKGIITRDIDLRHLPAGAYTLSIRNGSNVNTRKLIKE